MEEAYRKDSERTDEHGKREVQVQQEKYDLGYKVFIDLIWKNQHCSKESLGRSKGRF